METRVIVLAAGKGKRMKSELPKVLTLLRGRPMITYLLDAIARSGVDSRPTLVIGTGADLVEQQLGGGYDYVLQEELLGTGHAVSCAMKEMKDSGDAIIVLYGDHPFVKAETIQKLKATHEAQQPALTMVTVLLDDFEGWRAPFY
ncbi:NTP transferase domain-containing protein, partial [Candidatus Uhrbacteria bacterium]|nr:NTP transferase domain-containing protein [Candidatus Uhrbacteria bacterium]